MTPEKIRTSKTTPRKILISLAGLFGCGLVSLLAAVAAPGAATAAPSSFGGLPTTASVRFHNSGPSLDVEFALTPQNCDREPAQRHAGVFSVRPRQSIALELANDCDWVGTMVGCNAQIEFKDGAHAADRHPPGVGHHTETSGSFTLTRGLRLRWNGHFTQNVMMYRHIAYGDLGCHSFHNSDVSIAVPGGAELVNHQGHNVFAGTTIAATFTGSAAYCQVVVDRIPQASNVVNFTVANDGSVTPARVSFINRTYYPFLLDQLDAKEDYARWLRQADFINPA